MSDTKQDTFLNKINELIDKHNQLVDMMGAMGQVLIANKVCTKWELDSEYRRRMKQRENS